MSSGGVHLVGIGRIGLPVLRRLIASGHTVTAHDPDPARLALAREAGARIPADASLAEADVVVTALPVPAALTEFVAEAALPAPGALWIDLTSCDPDSGAAVATTLDARGVTYVAAPLAGGPAAAEAGTLRFHVGGADAAVERALPYLAELGGASALAFRATAPRAAYLAKLLVNGVWFAQAAALGEALVIAERHGIPPADLAGALRGSPALRALLDETLGEILEGADGGPFELERIVGQLDAVAGAATRAGVDAPLADATARLHRDALRDLGPGAGELRAIRRPAGPGPTDPRPTVPRPADG